MKHISFCSVCKWGESSEMKGFSYNCQLQLYSIVNAQLQLQV